MVAILCALLLTLFALPALTLTRGARRLTFLAGSREIVFLRGGLDHMNLWRVDLGGYRTPARDSPNTGWRTAACRAYADFMSTPAFALASLIPFAVHAQLLSGVPLALGLENWIEVVSFTVIGVLSMSERATPFESHPPLHAHPRGDAART